MPATVWTLDSFVAASKDRGPSVVAIVERFRAWLAPEPGAYSLGNGATGPLYYAPTARSGRKVPFVSIALTGEVLISFDDLMHEPPFDRLAERLRYQERLSTIIGFEMKDTIVESATWQTVDGAYLLSPGAFDQFVEVSEWVAAELRMGNQS